MSVKHCPKCQQQGAVVDSRHFPHYVRRRYACRNIVCKHRWTSEEFLISEGKHRNTNLPLYLQQRNQLATKRLIDRLLKILTRVSKTLEA